MSHHFVEQQDDRGAVSFGEIESFEGQVERLRDRGGAEGDDGVVTVGAPPGLHHVSLRGRRR
jgi:hypothetical protein